MADGDVMLTPSAPGAAPDGLGSTGEPTFNRLWTLLGTPCVNVPGLSTLPVCRSACRSSAASAATGSRSPPLRFSSAPIARSDAADASQCTKLDVCQVLFWHSRTAQMPAEAKYSLSHK